MNKFALVIAILVIGASAAEQAFAARTCVQLASGMVTCTGGGSRMVTCTRLGNGMVSCR
jgi:hypothetical protein